MLPFPGGITATQNGLLIFSLVASALFLYLLREPAGTTRALSKAASIVLLALIAFLANGPIVLVAALLLAAMGDYLLALENDVSFQLGLSAFLLAQMALVILFFAHYEDAPLALFTEIWRFPLAVLAVGHSAYLARRLWQSLPREMGVQILAYGFVITLMAIAALSFAPLVVVIGVTLFYISDTLIAHERFLLNGEVNQHPVLSPAIWVTYYLAQMLITLGVLL